jgi:hypothetical protein
MEGTRRTRSPSFRVQDSPPRKRMSSSLALVVADVAAEIGEARGEFVEGFGDGGCATVYFRRAVRETAERGGDFDRHWHV